MARGNSSVVFQLLKVALDKIALFVQLMVVIPQFLTITARRNDRLCPCVGYGLNKGIGIISFVSNDKVSQKTGYQFICFRVV